jgi:hypothetical protein
MCIECVYRRFGISIFDLFRQKTNTCPACNNYPLAQPTIWSTPRTGIGYNGPYVYTVPTENKNNRLSILDLLVLQGVIPVS